MLGKSRKGIARRQRNLSSDITRAVSGCEMLERRTLLSVSLTGVPNWVAQGPAPITSGAAIGPTAATSLAEGADNAIAVDPNNSKHLFVASVNGGIWQTSDFTVANPTWTTTTDQMPSLAIDSIAFSPTDSNTIYAGTGSYSSIFLRSFGGDVNIGGQGGAPVGVYKSTDGGATWKIDNPAGIFSGLRIIRIVPTTLNGGQTVFAATTDGGTSGGVFRSDDGGGSWTRLSGSNGLPNSGVTDLVANPGNASQFFAATSNTIAGSNAGIYRLDVGVSNTNWVNVTNNMAAGDLGASERIELSISPAGANPVWASIINATRRNSSDQLTTQGEFYQRVYRGLAGGGTVSWTSIGPVSGGVNQPPDVLAGNQGDVHGAIVADPANDTLVYISGDRLTNGGFGTNRGYIARGDSSANTWTAITPNGTGGSSGDPGTAVPTSNSVTTSPHADSRTMVFASGGDLLLGSDGGVYQCTNPSSTVSGAQTWTSINGTMQDTEFYDASYDSQFHIIYGGAQDNGTPSQNSPGSVSAYNDQTGGDGPGTAVDNVSLASMSESVRYFIFGAPGGATRKWFNSATGRVSGDNDAAILPQAGLTGLTSSTTDDLFNGLTVNGIDGRVVVSGGNNTTTPVGAVYESSDAGSAGETMVGTSYFVNDTWNAIPTDTGSVTGIPFVAATAMAAGGTLSGVNNPDVLYVASGSKVFLRSTAGGTLTATAGQPAGAGSVVAIKLDPSNWKTAFITDGAKVFMTNNAGGTWTNITGNLTNPPGSRGAPAVLSVVAGAGVDAVLFGGSKGVSRMLTSAPGVWSRYGANLPNVFTGGMVYNAADDVLVENTYGRGAWEVANASTTVFSTAVLQIDGTPGNDTIKLVIDANNPLLLDATLNGTVYQFPLATIQQIKVNGMAGDDTIVVDESNGAINVADGIQIDGGTGNDTLSVVGQNNAWNITGLNSGTVNGISFSDIQNLTGGSGDDLFQFATGGSVLGAIDGGAGGANTLDYSALAGPVTVNLQADSASDIGTTFSNINHLNGGTSPTDVLIGPNVTSTWMISGPSSGSVAGTTFSSFENLTGGSSSDTFAFKPGGSVSGNVDGGGGFNTLDYSAIAGPISVSLLSGTASKIGGSFSNINNFVGSASTADTFTGPAGNNAWSISGTNSGSVAGNNFSSFENLVGGPGNDVFAFSPGGVVSGNVNGDGGNNSLDYSALAGPITVNLQTNTAPGIGGVFSNINNFLGSASTTDTLIGPSMATSWTISGANSGTVGSNTFSSFENLVGGSGNDTFAFQPGGTLSGNLDGGAGTNTLDYSALAGPVTVNLQTDTASNLGGTFANVSNFVGSAGSDSLIGPNVPTQWNMTSANGGTSGADTFSSFENLFGGSANDTFSIYDGGSLSGEIDGGGGTNTLDYSHFSGSVIVNLALNTATGIAGGVFNIQGIVGGSGNNMFIGNAANNLFIGGSGRNILIGGGGSDTLIGGAGDSLLIGDSTIYDTNSMALAAIFAEWTRTDLSFEQRVADLISPGNQPRSLNGVYTLNKASVIDDGAPDTLIGGTGLTWAFVDKKRDTFSGKAPRDHVTQV